MAREKLVLAYSGGLDTSVCVRWINEKYDMDVIALTVGLGQGKDLEQVRQKALRTGAIDAIVVDARQVFVDYFVWPALMAGAVYEGKYPLATALGRPLIAKLMVDLAHETGAAAVAHGATGKGNDQVRFEVSTRTLDPSLRIVAPVREWGLTRDDEIAYAHKYDIPIEVKAESPYSVDQNLWGRSCEAGVLEDPWVAPREDAYEWTVSPADAPDEPELVEITFDRGKPVAVDGQEMDGVALIEHLHQVAGRHGVGRVDHVENRLVGIKSREIYEAPAAAVLHLAHRELETLCLTKPCARFKQIVAQEYADLIYNGLWFSSFHQDLVAFVASSQRFVSGDVRIKLYKGLATIDGRKSPLSLYSHELATYETGDKFDHNAAVGFIKLWGLSQQTQAQRQTLLAQAEPLSLPVIPPKITMKDSPGE